MLRSKTAQMGKTAVLRQNGVEVLVASIRQQPIHRETFSHLGIDPRGAQDRRAEKLGALPRRIPADRRGGHHLRVARHEPRRSGRLHLRASYAPASGAGPAADVSASRFFFVAALAARLLRLCSRVIARDGSARNVRRGLLGRWHDVSRRSRMRRRLGCGCLGAAISATAAATSALCSSICRASAAAASAASCIACAAAARIRFSLPGLFARHAAGLPRALAPHLLLGLPRALGREPRGLQRGGAARLLLRRHGLPPPRRGALPRRPCARPSRPPIAACRSLGLAPRAVAIARDPLLQRVARLHRPEHRLRGGAARAARRPRPARRARTAASGRRRRGSRARSSRPPSRWC